MSETAKLILVVDDDAMNRKLTGMFLKKLGYESIAVTGGREALDAVRDERFSLILMDYRMPEMDGVETTKLLRSMEGEYYKSVPVIALTGDERTDVRLEFEEAGINDVLQKPLGAESLSTVLKSWLEKTSDVCGPDETGKVHEGMPECEPEKQENGWEKEYALLEEAGICIQAGIHNCGSIEVWKNFLKDFYNMIDFKIEKLVKYLSEEQFMEYTIEVHALKNSARIIGALELSADFGTLEEWGNQKKFEKIVENNPQILEKMLQYKKVLSPFSEEGREKQTVSNTQIMEVLWAMQSAVETFDIDGVDFCMEELERYKIQGCDSQMAELRAYVADVALEDILEVISKIIGIIEKAE